MLGKKFFLTATKGAFNERSDTEQFNSFNSIEGHLVNITYKETSRGDIIRLHVIDENNFYLLSLYANSRCAHAFYMFIKNLNLLLPVAFKIKSVHGKDVFYAVQNGNSVRWYYGIDTVNRLPQQITERLPFLKEMIQAEIVPALQKKHPPYPNHPVYKPFTKGLQGGYFDAYASTARVPGPIGSTEQEYYNEHGRP